MTSSSGDLLLAFNLYGEERAYLNPAVEYGSKLSNVTDYTVICEWAEIMVFLPAHSAERGICLLERGICLLARGSSDGGFRSLADYLHRYSRIGICNVKVVALE